MTDHTNQPRIHLKAGLLIVAFAILGACAQAPENIAPAYISQARFKAWNCEQLVQEQKELASALTTASAQQHW